MYALQYVPFGNLTYRCLFSEKLTFCQNSDVHPPSKTKFPKLNVFSSNFYTALTSHVSVQKSKGWVKIYNEEMVKIYVTLGPLKLCQREKSFQMRGELYLFYLWKNMFSWNNQIHMINFLILFLVSLQWRRHFQTKSWKEQNNGRLGSTQ